MDIVTLAVAKSYTDEAISGIGGGITYKGAVNYYSSLPSNASVGDAYTVKYKGSSGTDPDGSEYVWGNYEGTNQWIKLGADDNTLIVIYTKNGNQTYQTVKHAVDNQKSIIGWIVDGSIIYGIIRFSGTNNSVSVMYSIGTSSTMGALLVQSLAHTSSAITQVN